MPRWEGHVVTEATRSKISKSRTEYYKIHKHDMLGISHTEKHKENISKAMIAKGSTKGTNNGNWQGGSSFKPYCPTFNDSLKETIRNRDNRVCQLCGKSEILNHGYRLCVHHIDGDKMQGCDNKKWYLASLCTSCNSKTDTIKKEFLLVSNMPYRGIATENLAGAVKDIILLKDKEEEEGGDKK